MKTLAARKHLLIAQADLHRQIIGIERLRLSQRFRETRDLVNQHRWWMLGGAVITGWWLTTRKRRSGLWFEKLAGWIGKLAA